MARLSVAFSSPLSSLPSLVLSPSLCQSATRAHVPPQPSHLLPRAPRPGSNAREVPKNEGCVELGIDGIAKTDKRPSFCMDDDGVHDVTLCPGGLETSMGEEEGDEGDDMEGFCLRSRVHEVTSQGVMHVSMWLWVCAR